MYPKNLGQAFRYFWLAARSLDPRRVLWSRRISQTSHTETGLLARVEEFNQAAEKQWQEIASEASGRAHVLGKPLSTVRETPEVLYRVGLVLEALDLGAGHVVLDFGAGSCWLSAILNRLGCRTISVDVSATALALGAEAFELDARQRPDLDPTFLPYDGHRIPLPSESVDRVVCFDAFHHVPNQREVLGEIYRVLREGGRATLAEPGEGHSQEGQSEFDATRYGVLENEP